MNKVFGFVSFFLLLFIPSCLLIGVGGYLFAIADIRHQQRQLQTADASDVSKATIALRQQLHNMSAEVEFLAEMPAFQDLINNPSDEQFQKVAAYFKLSMTTHGLFDQIRWIDQSGKERLRLNYIDHSASVVLPADLQDKSHRSYFTKISKSSADTIFVSPFELNIEHEQIERPFKPVIRIGMAVFDSSNQRQGILIINYLGRNLLDEFVHSIGDKGNRLFLLNHEGYWLRGPKAEDEWGFMLNPSLTVAIQNVPLWRDIVNTASGKRLGKDGLWTWNRLTPLDDIETGFQRTSPRKKIEGGGDHYIWHAVMFLPNESLAAIERATRRKISLPVALLTVVSIVFSAWLAYSHKRIENLNLDLSRRAEQALASNEAKSRFLANMSHEIRTPLNAVLGLAYLLEKANITRDASEMATKIRAEGRSLLHIINGILDFSKIEAGQLELERAPFKLSELLDRLSTTMSINVGSKPIELTITPPGIPLEQLYGDALRLEQILTNLTSNAIKFTHLGHVDLTVAVIDELEKQVSLKFSVRDTGIGISQEKQKEIFSPFFQADSSTTRRFGGTGLGLSISRWLVSEMGGEMGVVSVLGSGSEFWFTLTLEKAKYSPISTTESSGLEVLIADDSSIACDAMRNIVAMLGWKADIVSSGEEALQHVLSRFQSVKADDSRKRVIILDWKMPGMDGLATARAIREYVKDGNDPIIVMVTAFSRNEVLALPDSKYINAVLNKPVTPSSLNGTISNLLSVQVDDKTTVSKALGQRLSGLRLLIVDDSDINREVARRIFSNEGASIVLANDGRQALAWLESHPGGVDLVIMDVQMPVMDGYETTRRIRTIPALASIPVIAVTAGAFKDQQEAAKAAGMDDFIAKPIDVENAIALILYRAGLRDKRGSVKTADQTASRSYDNLPDLDEEHGLAVWQDQLVYKQYLRKFAKDYGGSTANMKQMGNLQAAELAHKLKGAAGSLALTKLETLANEISRILRAGQDATEITTQLQVALDNALASIQRYAPRPTIVDKPVEDIDVKRLSDLLVRTLKAFDTDNNMKVLKELVELNKVLPAESLSDLYLAVENFDFRGGEAVTRALATQFNITLD